MTNTLLQHHGEHYRPIEQTEAMKEACGPICQVFTNFINFGGEFTEALAKTLQPGLQDIFIAAVGIWVLWQSFLFFAAKKSPGQLLIDFAPIAAASILMGTQGSNLIITVYHLALETMSGAAMIAFSVGGDEVETAPNYAGLQTLALLGEQGLDAAFKAVETVFKKGDALNPLAWFIGAIMIALYFLILFAFISQLIVAVFRLIILSILAPFLIMAFSFNWGRSMAFAGLRTVLATMVTVFTSTSAFAVAIYGARTIDSETIDKISLSDPVILSILGMGIIGTALMTEGVSIANSVTQSSLTNTAAGIMTAGAMATVGGAKAATMSGIGNRAAIGGAMGNVAGGAWRGAGIVGSALASPGGAAGAVASAAAEKLQKFNAFYNVGKDAAKANFSRFS